ncbi:hypothetical protein TIFTF001_012442 [Ficus carica]|uniref:Protein TIFY n=1 Tax=Ficus carica TaxID=3494 RepID=A0AA87ZZ05_FICCA|nr:hypothetical protein TIFTF001_012442 [Ficus carica]
MRRNCNLELRLLPAYLSPSDTNSDDRRTEKTTNESPETREDHPQPLTIFYNGQICVCDVTEFQARAIIWLASREKEERVKTPTAGSGQCSPSVQSSPYSPTAALSMKKSLQRFLQTRKHRAQAMSPYYR